MIIYLHPTDMISDALSHSGMRVLCVCLCVYVCTHKASAESQETDIFCLSMNVGTDENFYPQQQTHSLVATDPTF